jgi:predicted RNA binding protein YcfA (HicA-like mRNA interferase family)
MKYGELWKLLRKHGWKLEEGTNHEVAVDPKNPKHKVRIPRHKKELKTKTLESILKDTGLK